MMNDALRQAQDDNSVMSLYLRSDMPVLKAL